MYKLYLNPIADGKYRSLPTVIPEFQHWVSRLYGYEPVTDALYPIVIFFEGVSMMRLWLHQTFHHRVLISKTYANSDIRCNVLHENNQFIVIEGETHAAQFLFIETGNKILHLP